MIISFSSSVKWHQILHPVFLALHGKKKGGPSFFGTALTKWLDCFIYKREDLFIFCNNNVHNNPMKKRGVPCDLATFSVAFAPTISFLHVRIKVITCKSSSISSVVQCFKLYCRRCGLFLLLSWMFWVSDDFIESLVKQRVQLSDR